jgi:hypothetical protein
MYISLGSVEDDDPEAMDNYEVDTVIDGEALPDGEYNSDDSTQTKKRLKKNLKKNMKNIKNLKKNGVNLKLSDENDGSGNGYVKTNVDRKRKRKDKIVSSVIEPSVEIIAQGVPLVIADEGISINDIRVI